MRATKKSWEVIDPWNRNSVVLRIYDATRDEAVDAACKHYGDDWILGDRPRLRIRPCAEGPAE